MKRRLPFIPLALALAFAVPPAPAVGQESGVTLEAYAGLADFGRFLEERVGLPAREREATFGRTTAFGGSLGMNLWEKTGIRVQGTYVPTELVFEDDTPDGNAMLDDEDVADVTVTSFGAEVLKYMLDPGRGWSPYAVAGVTAVRWSTDDTDITPASSLQTNEEDTLWRMGGVAGLGLELRPTDALAVRLEASTYGLGSPFDGSEAWSTSGTTIDEPTAGRMTRATIGLAWTFGMGTDRGRRTRRGMK